MSTEEISLISINSKLEKLHDFKCFILSDVSHSSIAKIPNVTTIRLSSVATFALNHTGYHFFFLIHVLVSLFLGSEESDDGQDYIIVGKCRRVVKADST